MPSCRSIPQFCMTALLAWGAINAQTQPTGRQSAPNPNPAASAEASGSQKPARHTARRTYVSSSLLSRRTTQRSRPVAALPSPNKIVPSPPRISYAEGKLTVFANNSALSDVLNAIQNATGAKIEGVTPTNADRVFGQFGPAPAREVCGALLSGSGYDFIIVEAPENPGSIQQIILTERSTEVSSQPAAPASGAPPAVDSADMADTNEPADANANDQPPAPEQDEEPFRVRAESEVQPPTQDQQQTTQGQAQTAPTRPQHWGANYPQPQPSPTPTPAPTPEQPH